MIFRVTAKTEPGETVCIVGDGKELGNWKAKEAVALKFDPEHGPDVWLVEITLHSQKIVQYRYFVAYLCDTEEGTRNIMVRRWETHLKPRQIDTTLPTQNGTITEFGYIDDERKEDKGWLTGQTEIQARLHSTPINMWKLRHRQQSYRIKCTPVDMRYNDMPAGHEEESSHDLPVFGAPNTVYVSVLKGQESARCPQPQFGTLLQDGDYMVFSTQTFDQETLGFQFDFYVCHPSSDETEQPKHVGSSYLLPSNRTKTLGVRTVPIIGLKGKPIGQLAVEYLIIKPLPANLASLCDMRVSFSRHWNRRRGPLDIGHRGLGSSYCTEEVAVKENTIASLAEAGSHGADFVEFDVQLSKDDIPVIYHDFMVGLSLKKKHQVELEWFEIPVQDLSLTQLQMLKINHVSVKDGNHETKSSDMANKVESRAFPTLQECFQHIDIHVGFNIEVKYCMYMKQGGMEEGLKHYQEHNRYLDLILEVILRHAGNRRIILSCFDPDICTMLRLKQNKYPVLFLCFNEGGAWPPYKDPRTWSVTDAMATAHCERLMGVNSYGEDILKNPEVVQQALDMGLVIFAWGCNDKDNIKKMKEFGVDGVIYDKIYQIKGAKENVFKMEHESKVALLKEMGAIPESEITNKMSDRARTNAPSFAGIFPKTHGSKSTAEQSSKEENNGVPALI